MLHYTSEPESSYILGLWCADGYHRTSSIGLSNHDKKLIQRFGNFLLRNFPKTRLRLRVYHPIVQRPDIGVLSNLTEHIKTYNMKKSRKSSFHIYVNSRPLLREFRDGREKRDLIPSKLIPAYFAGRFDGDGSVNVERSGDLRIVYGDYGDAEHDRILMEYMDVHPRLYHYKKSGTFVLYILKKETKSFLFQIENLSSRLALTP